MTSAKTLFPESHSEVLGGHSSTHSGRPPSLRTCLPKPRVWLVTTVSISLLTLGLCSPVLSSSHSWLLSLEAPQPKEVLPQPLLSFLSGTRLPRSCRSAGRNSLGFQSWGPTISLFSRFPPSSHPVQGPGCPFSSRSLVQSLATLPIDSNFS